MSMPDPVMVAAADEATATKPVGEDIESVSRGTLVLRRFLRKRLAVFGLFLVVALFLLAFIGQHLTRWRYGSQDFTACLKPPSPSNWLGTTEIGEDVFAQTMR